MSLSSKHRFHGKEFNSKLQTARDFRRSPKPVGESSIFRKFSYHFSQNWLRVSLVSLILFLVVYLLYLPGIFSAKNIEVLGLEADEVGAVTRFIKDQSQTRNIFGFRRDSLILLSPNFYKKTILGNFPELRNTFSVRRVWPNGLIFKLDSRQVLFQVGSRSGVYAYYDDGGIKGQVSSTSNDFSSNPNNIKYEVWWQGDIPEDGKAEFPSGVFQKIKDSAANYQSPAGNMIDKFIVGEPGLPTEDTSSSSAPSEYREEIGYTDLVIRTKWLMKDKTIVSGYKIFLAMDSDIPETLARLNALLSKKSTQELQKIFYVDMRFANRAFLCNQGEVCSQTMQKKTPIEQGSELKLQTNQLTKPEEVAKPRGE